MYLKEQLYVVTISEQQTLSRAAEKLHLTQPALSIFLTSLEENLGMKLFQRSGRKLIPTPAGELYINTSRQMLRLQENFYSELSILKNSRPTILRIGLQRMRAPYLIPYIKAYFSNHYPDMQLIFIRDVTNKLIKALEQGELDFILSNKTVPFDEFDYYPLADEYLLLVVSRKTHAEISASKQDSLPYPVISLDQFKEDTFILQEETQSIRYHCQQLFKEQNFTPKRVLIESSIHAAAVMTSMGMGLSFSIESYVTSQNIKDSALDYYLIGNPPFMVHLSLIRKKDTALPNYLQDLIQYIPKIL